VLVSHRCSTTGAVSCHDTLVEQAEGPSYTTGAPERTVLTEAGTIGIPLTLAGRVLDASCAPGLGAPIEFWQADGARVYDNSGYALRGAQVAGPDGVVHTTQLYFPDVPQNDDDGIYSDTMLVTVTDQTDDGMTATFGFVLP
jgi:protocatechuate 3,4-dioxygenase beta subunit